MVVRRFWPMVGSVPRATADLAAELTSRGWAVTIVTARWQPSWPASIAIDGVPVVRLPHAPSGGWQTLRFVRCLARWLGHRREHCDLVHVASLRHEAYAAHWALRGRVPVVLRPASTGRVGDCRWQLDSRFGRWVKRKCMQAAAVAAPGPDARRELEAAGYDAGRIHDLSDGVRIPPERTPAVKRAARAALAETDRVFQMPDRAPLAVYTGRLHTSRALRYLVAAWQPIASRWPGARLWLAGEGPDRETLLRQIASLRLSGSVVPVGVFDEVDELLAAADLFVMPAPRSATPRSLIEAMAAGLPVVAGDAQGIRTLIGDEENGLIVPETDATALGAAMERLLSDPDLAARLGAEARAHAVARYSLTDAVDCYADLFQRLIEENSRDVRHAHVLDSHPPNPPGDAPNEHRES